MIAMRKQHLVKDLRDTYTSPAQHEVYMPAAPRAVHADHRGKGQRSSKQELHTHRGQEGRSIMLQASVARACRFSRPRDRSRAERGPEKGRARGIHVIHARGNSYFGCSSTIPMDAFRVRAAKSTQATPQPGRFRSITSVIIVIKLPARLRAASYCGTGCATWAG